MAGKYLPMDAKIPKPLPLARITIGVAGALTVAFGYHVLSGKVAKPQEPEIVYIDPWSECIKQAAEAARLEKMNFEALADTKCKGLTTAPKSTPA